MARLLQFLTSESPLAWLIAGAILGLLALIVIVGLVQGREISFWPPRLGPRPGSVVPSGQQPQASATGPLWVENSRRESCPGTPPTAGRCERKGTTSKHSIEAGRKRTSAAKRTAPPRPGAVAR